MDSALLLCSDETVRMVVGIGASPHLLSFLSQFDTLAFQSHVCLSISNANPDGHVIGLSPDRVHLQ